MKREGHHKPYKQYEMCIMSIENHEYINKHKTKQYTKKSRTLQYNETQFNK